jgi:cyclopropane-fatty-acyl-phospholipid synthase
LIAEIGRRARTPFCVRFPDGGVYRNADAAPAFTLWFRSERALRRAALYGHVGVLEAYFDGELDIEGSLPKALAVGMEGGADQPTWLVRLRNRWHELVHANANRSRAKRNAEFHYALPPEFYKLWLDDPYMFYTCAY